MGLSHLDDAGRARMVDVGGKPVTERVAEAEGWVRMSQEAFRLAAAAALPKGDLAGVARLAGIMGAKRAAELIPLCHPVALDQVELRVEPDPALPGIRVAALARATGRTGVEMEALTAVAVACLTVYDMVKAVDRGPTIEAVRLVSKTGGTHGDWRRAAESAARPRP